MKLCAPTLLLVLLAPVAAADHTTTTFCTKYTTALFGVDTGENELKLAINIVRLAVMGNEKLGVPGILAPEGGLASFFSGVMPTTNRGDQPVAIDFLDDAVVVSVPKAAAAVPQNNNLAVLLDHLYQFFGALLGCTAAGFPEYQGEVDMFRVHKFMGLEQDMNDFFISQIGLAASTFGVSDEDVMAVVGLLDSTFNTRCPPPIREKSGLPEFWKAPTLVYVKTARARWTPGVCVITKNLIVFHCQRRRRLMCGYDETYKC